MKAKAAFRRQPRNLPFCPHGQLMTSQAKSWALGFDAYPRCVSLPEPLTGKARDWQIITEVNPQGRATWLVSCASRCGHMANLLKHVHLKACHFLFEGVTIFLLGFPRNTPLAPPPTHKKHSEWCVLTPSLLTE